MTIVIKYDVTKSRLHCTYVTWLTDLQDILVFDKFMGHENCTKSQPFVWCCMNKWSDAAFKVSKFNIRLSIVITDLSEGKVIC